MRMKNFISRYKYLLLTFFFMVFYWIAEAAFDTIFHNEYIFLYRIFFLDMMELWMRLTTEIIILSFGITIYFFSRKQKKQEQQIISLARFPDENPNPVFRIGLRNELIYANKPAIELIKAIPASLYKSIIQVDNIQERFIELKLKNQYWLFQIQFIKEMEYTNIYGIDITEKKQLEFYWTLLEQVFNNTIEGIMITDNKRQIIHINSAFTSITGYSALEIVGKSPSIMKSGKHDALFYQEMNRQLLEKGFWQGEIWDKRKNGEIYPKWLSLSTVRDSDKNIQNFIGIFSDISSVKVTEDYFDYLAFHDTLTGLPNRLLFNERVHYAILDNRGESSKLAIMMLDLDRFKKINDSLGHSLGDSLIIEVSQRLSAILPESATLARLGGDEFALVIPGVESEAALIALTQNILNVLSSPFQIGEQRLYITLSIGIALHPNHGKDIESLLKNADAALFLAKENGRNRFEVYSPVINERSFTILQRETEFNQALVRDEIVVFYQPKIDIHRFALAGMEALVRWVDFEGKIIPPYEFISIAEETGLIIPMGERVLKLSCNDMQEWRKSRPGVNLKVSVNLSARQFSDKFMVEKIARALDQSGLEAEYLDVEITESAVMIDLEKSIDTMNQLKNMGISISLDDFGTGYSSLNYLRRFPIDFLKIDQSFVRDLELFPQVASIIRAIIQMSHALNIQVVAEGVENNVQARFLQNQGCDYIQGYYFSRPVPKNEFERLIDNRSWLLEKIWS